LFQVSAISDDLLCSVFIMDLAVRSFIAFLSMERSALTVVDDLDEELDELTMLSMMVGFRSRATQKTRIKFYAESVVPAYSSIDFKSHFRLSRETTEVH